MSCETCRPGECKCAPYVNADGTIYVVMGVAGSHAEASHWPVAAFRSLPRAKQRAANAVDWVLEHGRDEHGRFSELVLLDAYRLGARNPHDPDYHPTGSDAPNYYVLFVPWAQGERSPTCCGQSCTAGC